MQRIECWIYKFFPGVTPPDHFSCSDLQWITASPWGQSEPDRPCLYARLLVHGYLTRDPACKAAGTRLPYSWLCKQGCWYTVTWLVIKAAGTRLPASWPCFQDCWYTVLMMFNVSTTARTHAWVLGSSTWHVTSCWWRQLVRVGSPVLSARPRCLVGRFWYFQQSFWLEIQFEHLLQL